jgi:hypothetical protein
MFMRSRAVMVGLVVALVGLPATTIASSTASADTPMYMVVMGDSIAQGVGASSDSTGFAEQIYQRELANFPGLVVENFTCTPAVPNGESAHSMLNGPYNCSGPNFDMSGPPLPSQLAGAEAFLQQHVGQIAFVAIDIGAHDDGGNALLKHDLSAILTRLKAADPGIRIFGANYYNPSLANWLGGPNNQAQVRGNEAMGKSFNDFLASIYRAAGVPVVDAPAVFDNDNFALTGTWKGKAVPQNVANLCTYVHTCTSGDPHPNDDGYTLYGDAFARLIDNDPATPTAVDASPQDSSAVVSWTAPKPTNGPPLTGYVVTPYLVSGGKATAQTARTFANTKTSQTISSLTNGKTYLFKVAAQNATGAGTPSAATPAIKIGKVTPPKNSCLSSSGTGTFTPGLPVKGSTVKSSMSFKGTLSGCSGGGVKSGHLTFTSSKGAPTNCQTFVTTYGPNSKGAVGTATIKWNTGKTSTLTLTSKLASSTAANLSNVTGTVTSGLFQGSHMTSQVGSSTPSDACVSKPATTFSYSQATKTVFK